VTFEPQTSYPLQITFTTGGIVTLARGSIYRFICLGMWIRIRRLDNNFKWSICFSWKAKL